VHGSIIHATWDASQQTVTVSAGAVSSESALADYVPPAYRDRFVEPGPALAHPQHPNSIMSKTNTRPREGTSALIAGITLFEKTIRKTDEERYTNQVVRASAQVDGQQEVCERSISHHGLEEALRQACEWRFERADVPYESAQVMTEAALSEVPDDMEKERN